MKGGGCVGWIPRSDSLYSTGRVADSSDVYSLTGVTLRSTPGGRVCMDYRFSELNLAA